MVSERRELLLKYIRENGQVTQKELAKLCPDVSDMTLRRDLAYLEERGHIIRTRGGAVATNSFSMIAEDIYSQRALQYTEEKHSIARAALQFVQPNCAIFIDSGSTMMAFTKQLPDESYFIITAGANIALEAVRKNKPSVTLIGGNLSRNTLSASGYHSIDVINTINIDLAFMSCSGFGLDTGFTSGSHAECELKRAVIKKARRKIMLMDSSKQDKRMPFTFAHLSDIDVLVTDSGIHDIIVTAARTNNVNVINNI